MTANNANSKISIENCQRFMKRQVVQNKNYSSLGPLSIGTIAVGGHGWEENRSDSIRSDVGTLTRPCSSQGGAGLQARIKPAILL